MYIVHITGWRDKAGGMEVCGTTRMMTDQGRALRDDGQWWSQGIMELIGQQDEVELTQLGGAGELGAQDGSDLLDEVGAEGSQRIQQNNCMA